MMPRGVFAYFLFLALCSTVVPQKNGGGHAGSPGGGSHGGSLGGGSIGGGSHGGSGGFGGIQQPKQGGGNPLGGFGGIQQPKQGGSNPLGGGFGGIQQPKQGGSNPLGGGFGGIQQPKQGGGNSNPLGGWGGNQPKSTGGFGGFPGQQPKQTGGNLPHTTTIRQPPSPTNRPPPGPTNRPPPGPTNRPPPGPTNRPPPSSTRAPPGWTPRPGEGRPGEGRPGDGWRPRDPPRETRPPPREPPPRDWNRPGQWNRPGEHRPDWHPEWDHPRGGNDWRRTTIIGGPTVVLPTVTQWLPPRTVYNTWDNNWGFAPPNIILPPLPPITINVPVPRPGCSLIPTTYPTVTETEATFTSTITQPPPDAVVTVYYDPVQNMESTYFGAEMETVYEIIVYTTTATLDVISSRTRCGIEWWKAKRTAVPGEAVEEAC